MTNIALIIDLYVSDIKSSDPIKYCTEVKAFFLSMKNSG